MNRIKLILVIVALLISNIAVSQTLHAIIFADTYSHDIGASVREDYKNMGIEFALIAEANGFQSKIYDSCIGENFNRQTADKVLNELRCGSNDVVFFYYSGHGNRSASQYPQLGLKGGTIALHTIDEIIARKNPRLRIIMADCCNGSIREDIKPQGDLGYASKIDTNSEKVYRSLFGDSVKGSIIIASSQPGENSISLEKGGAFTFSFLQEMQKMKASGANANWNTLLERSKNATSQIARHTPVFNVDPLGRLIAVGGITPPPEQGHINQDITVPPPPPPPFEEALAQLINGSLGDVYRINLIQPVLNQYFDKNAVVRIYGRNGTLVRRETAKDFLGRIAIAHNLVRLVQQDSQKAANGKYTEINFHEIYRD